MYTPKIQIRNGELWVVKYGQLRRQMCYRDRSRPCGIDCVLFDDISMGDDERMNKYELCICQGVFISPSYEYRDDAQHDSLGACDIPTPKQEPPK